MPARYWGPAEISRLCFRGWAQGAHRWDRARVRSGSIYEAGADAFLRLAAAHHARRLADPVLNHPCSHGGHPEHISRLPAY
jgi:hypothetical protein